MVKVNREELAWAAGFFDGEGNTSFGSKPTIRRDGSVFKGVMVQIGQAESIPGECPEVLSRFKNAVGGIGVIMGPYPTGHKPAWRYQASGFEASQAVIAMLWTFLGEVKKKQAKEKLQAWLAQPRLSCGVKHDDCKGGHGWKNISYTKKGYRYCVDCSKENWATYSAKRKVLMNV